MKSQITITMLSLAMAALAANANVDRQRVVRATDRAQAPVEHFGGVTKAPRLNTAEGSVTADFTVRGNDALSPVLVYGFDDGFGGWTPTNGKYVTWTTKRVAEAGNAKSFSNINPNDVASLYVEGPYQTYRRETSSIVSPTFEVPANGMLHFYVGFSQNYDDVCRLNLSASSDNFATETTLWNSKEENGEKPWRWHEISIDISSLAGKTIALKLTYGPGSSDSFNTGGYLGDFSIDDITVSGMKALESLSVTTGDKIELVDISKGDVKSRSWSMPGAVPSTSTDANPVIYYTADGNYDISLTVTDTNGLTSTVTRPAFVKVTGTAPVAKIVPPATFRYSSTRKYMVAPLVPVTYTDGSKGFPTDHTWTFTGVSPEAYQAVTSTEANPSVAYNYLHEQVATLDVSNSHGTSYDEVGVSVEYSGVATNMRPTDKATVFDMQDFGVFPGSNNRKITAFAEKFSKPSRPIVVSGAYVYFFKADALELVDQIRSVGVHLYTSKNGVPDKKLDSWWWNVNELDLPGTTGDLVGTSFPFTEAPVINDEFFIVVDGLPEYDSEGTCVSFGMAAFRGEGNTAYMLKNGVWTDVSTYFPAGANHTSYMIYPSVTHSVMAPLTTSDGVMAVGADAGTLTYQIFSIMGYESPIDSDASWLRVTSEPSGYTVDDLTIAYDALPAGTDEREGHLTLTDGATSMVVTIKQSRTNSVSAITVDGGVKVCPAVVDSSMTLTLGGNATRYQIYSSGGTLMHEASVPAGTSTVEVNASDFAPGVYVVVSDGGSAKFVKR